MIVMITNNELKKICTEKVLNVNLKRIRQKRMPGMQYVVG